MNEPLFEVFWKHFQKLEERAEFHSTIQRIRITAGQRSKTSPCVLFLAGAMMATLWKDAGINIEREKSVELTIESLARWFSRNEA